MSRLDHASARALLPILKSQAVARSKPYIRLIVPDGTPLIRTAADFGARDTGRYQWQLHVPDTAHLLRTIAPVLEQRIAGSMFAGLTDTLTICLYRETVVLRFESGKLASVETTPVPINDGAICIPPLLFPLLVFGWRTRAELAERYPDFLVWERRNTLIDVLFPRMTSSLSTLY
ncbi:MAG: hypothetical protein IPK19_35840 [Chloroflexi bacterium]|nr:hypothetical protein [Chloroflexota bacterium]